jgi:hypothetical protein
MASSYPHQRIFQQVWTNLRFDQHEPEHRRPYPPPAYEKWRLNKEVQALARLDLSTTANG